MPILLELRGRLLTLPILRDFCKPLERKQSLRFSNGPHTALPTAIAVFEPQKYPLAGRRFAAVAGGSCSSPSLCGKGTYQAQASPPGRTLGIDRAPPPAAS